MFFTHNSISPWNCGFCHSDKKPSSSKSTTNKPIITLSMRSLKKKTDSKKKDMISELPDDVLISIITRLKHEDSIETSILSKRWRNLYKLVPEIELQCRDMVYSSSWFSRLYYSLFSGCRPSPHDGRLIIKRMDRFLRLRSGTKIRTFRFLICLNKSHTNQFEQWVRSLGKMGVEELVLQLRCDFSYHHSDLSFNCGLISGMPSLKSLKLALCCLQPINITKTLCNKSLKILILHSVELLPGSFECILSSCLSLQTLAVNLCEFQSCSKLSIRGTNLQLKSLYITNCGDIKEMEFYASNLTTFEFRASRLATFVFDHVPRLQSIFLYVYPHNILSSVRGKLAQDLPHLKSLAFTTRLSHKEEIHRSGMRIHTFSNLRQLDIKLYGAKDMNLLLLTRLLQNCPLLQEFHLDTNYLSYSRAPAEMQATIVPHTELKKVEFSGFIGRENELKFASYVLRSAVNLELMHINKCGKSYTGFGGWQHYDDSRWSEETKQTIHEQLQGQAISKTAQIVIQHGSLYEEDKWGRSGGIFGENI